MKYLLILLLFCGCGLHVSTDPVKVDPITVTATVGFNINFTQAQTYCNSVCAENTSCAEQCYTQFLNILAAASAVPSPTPSPTPH